MTASYPNLCYDEVCYIGTALFSFKKSNILIILDEFNR